MSYQKNILIVDDDARLRDQLVRLTREIIPDWQIIEADNYNSAIEKIDTNQINVLVSDLYLEPNEDLNQDINYNPSGVRLAEYFRKKQPDSFIYIVSSNLNSLISKNKNKFIEYINIGVNDFLDRNVTPNEKFSQKFQYQLQKLDQSIVQINSSAYKFWKAQDIKTYKSFWILILDLKDKKYSNLIADCIIWEKNLSEPGAAFLLLDLYDSKTSYLEENKVFDNIPHRTLFFSDNHELKDMIKISSQTLDRIRSKNELHEFLNIIHKKFLTGTTFHELKNEIQIPSFWNWLGYDNNWLGYDNIRGFSLKSGSLDYFSVKNTINYNHIAIIGNGNYNETIQGNYKQENNIDSSVNSSDSKKQNPSQH